MLLPTVQADNQAFVLVYVDGSRRDQAHSPSLSQFREMVARNSSATQPTE